MYYTLSLRQKKSNPLWPSITVAAQSELQIYLAIMYVATSVISVTISKTNIVVAFDFFFLLGSCIHQIK